LDPVTIFSLKSLGCIKKVPDGGTMLTTPANGSKRVQMFKTGLSTKMKNDFKRRKVESIVCLEIY
jgi:hypothetical protein